MRTDDIQGANPNKFRHDHKKYVFDGYVCSLFDKSLEKSQRY